MGVRVLVGQMGWRRGGPEVHAACLYDSVTMTAFGPVMTFDNASDAELEELADGFVSYVEDESGKDARKCKDSQLYDLYVAYLKKLSDAGKAEGEASESGSRETNDG